MMDRSHTLPVTKQAKALRISRGSVYYRPKPISEDDQGLMTRMDRLHMEWPFAGARMLRDLLRQEGFTVGRKHVATLMRRMGLEALYQKPRTTQRQPAHQVYPYLLRHLAITRVNHVWAMDVTYSSGPQFLDRALSETSAGHYAAFFSIGLVQYTASGVCRFKDW